MIIIINIVFNVNNIIISFIKLLLILFLFLTEILLIIIIIKK